MIRHAILCIHLSLQWNESKTKWTYTGSLVFSRQSTFIISAVDFNVCLMS